MTNPRDIITVKPMAAYQLPTYCVTNDGIVDGQGVIIELCKGDITNSEIFRQEGVFVESLLQAVITQLTSVNVGDLASRETAIAITKVQEALFWLQERAELRRQRNVLGTYKK